MAEPEELYRVGATARSKLALVAALCEEAVRRGEPTLVIGQYLDQLESMAQRLQAPLITGKPPNSVRERLYDAFRSGEEPLLVVSKARRQRFLAEQGYAYQILDGDDVLGAAERRRHEARLEAARELRAADR